MKKHHSLAQEKKTIAAMVKMYCRGHHATVRNRLCPGCEDLLQYALQRVEKCPFGSEKGPCAQCTIHCYKPLMREPVQEVMRYSGPRMLTRHPILAISHLLKRWKGS
ncbi:MAG: nitrous oxide-stimulated promoter family protein [Planctomycetota bacterium]